jgi:hypothetical protein
MKRSIFPTSSWLSYFAWLLGPTRWWVVATLMVLAASALLVTYFNHQAALVEEEVESLIQKIKGKRLGPRTTQKVIQNPVETRAQKATIKVSAASDQDRFFDLRLPSFQLVKVAPLGEHLSESRLNGVALKQVDYVWSKSTRPVGQDLSVGRVEVNLNLEGSYPAVRAWLGEVLFQEPHMQLSAIQFQRLAKDSALINCVMTLSVYFEDVR